MIVVNTVLIVAAAVMVVRAVFMVATAVIVVRAVLIVAAAVIVVIAELTVAATVTLTFPVASTGPTIEAFMLTFAATETICAGRGVATATRLAVLADTHSTIVKG